MSTTSKIEEGWNFIIQNQTSAVPGFYGADYVQSIDKAIQKLEEDINSQMGTSQGVGQLKGFIAEYWHADTFNINAALKSSSSRAFIEGSNKHASVDVSTNFNNNYSMKYYATGRDSALNQAKNVVQAYYEYLRKSKTQNPLSFEEYLAKYGYDNNTDELMKSVYYGQERIIPSDQLEDAIKFLRQKMATEAAKDGPNRAALYENYAETLQKLSDRIKDNNGVESVRLTKEESETIAALAKEGKFNREDFGFSLNSLITSEYILQQALKAGVTSAVITLVLQLAPEIFKTIDYLIKNSEIDSDQLKKVGFKAMTSSSEGFLRGAVSAAITISCKAGKLGSNFVNINPGVVGAITVIAIDTMKNSYMVSCRKMSFREMETLLTKELLISSASLAGGLIGQMVLPELPVLGYMLGSMVGSIVSSVTLNICEKTVLSYCSDTGFALFGLVDQNYELPTEIIERLGIEIVNFKQASVKKAVIKRATFKSATYKTQQYNTIEFTVLRRGVIGVNTIGYTI